MYLYLFYSGIRGSAPVSFSYCISNNRIDSEKLKNYGVLCGKGVRASQVSFSSYGNYYAVKEIGSESELPTDVWLIIPEIEGKVIPTVSFIDNPDKIELLLLDMLDDIHFSGLYYKTIKQSDSVILKSRLNIDLFRAFKVRLSKLFKVSGDEVCNVDYFMMIYDLANMKCNLYCRDENLFADYYSRFLYCNENKFLCSFYIIRKSKDTKVYVYKRLPSCMVDLFTDYPIPQVTTEVKLDNLLTKESYAKEILLRG